MSDNIQLRDEDLKEDRPVMLYELVSLLTQAAVRDQALATALSHVINREDEAARDSLKVFLERVDSDVKSLIALVSKLDMHLGA